MQNHEDVYLSLKVRANQRAPAGYFRADHRRHFAADRFVIVIERRNEYPLTERDIWDLDKSSR